MNVFRLSAPLILLSVSAVPGPAQTRFQHYRDSLAPYVVSPQAIVDRMLEIVELKPGETLYDLGSGDGRVLLTAAQKYHAKAVGVEISETLVRQTNERIEQLGLRNLARVIHGDLLRVDLSPADVVVLYLLTNSNEMLRPNLERYLKPGARVVSHEYKVPGWKPSYTERPEDSEHGHVIYLYRMPPIKTGR